MRQPGNGPSVEITGQVRRHSGSQSPVSGGKNKPLRTIHGPIAVRHSPSHQINYINVVGTLKPQSPCCRHREVGKYPYRRSYRGGTCPSSAVHGQGPCSVIDEVQGTIFRGNWVQASTSANVRTLPGALGTTHGAEKRQRRRPPYEQPATGRVIPSARRSHWHPTSLTAAATPRSMGERMRVFIADADSRAHPDSLDGPDRTEPLTSHLSCERSQIG
jgi:hypothetical protein